MSAERIAGYLDELTTRLHGSPTYVRRVVLEAQEHLTDSVERRVAEGAARDTAEVEALKAFGGAATVAREINRANWRAARPALLRDVGETGIRLVGVGMVVIGIAGAVAKIAAAVTSTSLVFGAPATLSPSPADCAHWASL